MNVPIFQKIEFPGHDGSMLAARLDLPVGEPRCFAVFAHCFTCGKDLFAASRVSAELARLGIAVLRFDFTGLGMSDGEFANTNFRSNVADLLAAADFLRKNHQAPALMVGHSLGGAAVLAAAGEIPELRAVATIGAPAEPSHLSHLFADKVEEIKATGEVEVSLGGRPFRIRQQFLDDIESSRLQPKIEKLGRPLLVMHSPVDEIVGVDQARQIFTAAKHPKSYISLDHADHLLRKPEDGRYAARVLAAWAERYLPASAAAPLEPGVVEVEETGEGGYSNRVRAGKHVVFADEPESVGGKDSGPGPYDFLLAGLGACTSMTLRMYANLKKIPLQSVRVRLRHGRVHAQDCGDCESTEGKVDEITREISLRGDLDATQRARLLEIADRCPVHRTLENEIKVRTRATD